MIGLVVALGAVGTTVAIALLFGKKDSSAADPGPPPPKRIDGGAGGDDEKRDDERDEGADPDDGGSASKIIGEVDKWKAKIGDIWSGRDIEDPPDDPPDKPVGPDPYSPSPTPTPGQYYQVVKNDTLWGISAAAYGVGNKYDLFVQAPENQWLAKPPATTWKGGLYAKYNGWNTTWLEGTQYPVIYIP